MKLFLQNVRWAVYMEHGTGMCIKYHGECEVWAKEHL